MHLEERGFTQLHVWELALRFVGQSLQYENCSISNIAGYSENKIFTETMEKL